MHGAAENRHYLYDTRVMMFEVLKKEGRARLGRFETPMERCGRLYL
jgi:hypothetical protein